MSINSVNYNIGNSYGAYIQRLTEATKRKLIELGIPFNEKTTEAQAQSMIQDAISKKTSGNVQSDIKNSNNGSDNTLEKRKNDTFERAKKLALQLGINVDDKADIKQILALIESILEAKINANKGNISVLKELKEFSNELSMIQAEANGSSGYDNKNHALMMSLEMLSEYNKNFLNR